jgi:hypothetical protein
MKAVAGVFRASADAARAADHLRSMGIQQVSVLTPGDSKQMVERRVPTSDTEQPGMGLAVGGVVGGAIGAAGGLELGAAAASVFLPGVGPVIAMGLLGAALLGAGGAAVGAATGSAIETAASDGLPKDELFVYEDALRRGRSVLIVLAKDDDQATIVRGVLDREGAESLDAAREEWWIGLRPAEEEEYRGEGHDFQKDEDTYRRGFEAALHPDTRGKPYEEAVTGLRDRYSSDYTQYSFRHGYERGHKWHKHLNEKYREEK